MNPLLPAIQNPYMLTPLCSFPLPVVLLWFCLITSCIYATFYRQSLIYGIFTLLIFGPWFWCIISISPEASPDWLATIGHLPMSFGREMSADAGQRILFGQLQLLHLRHPSVKLVILPESAWNNGALTNKKKLSWLIDHPIRHCIMGGFAQYKNKYRNSLYWFENGYQRQRYDKRDAVPLVECTIWTAESFCSSLYFPQSPPVYPSQKPRRPFYINDLGLFDPSICSELYCAPHADDDAHYPILMVSNDSWFLPYFQKLMALAVGFRALQWSRPILYIGYYYALYFDSHGISYNLPTTAPNRTIHS